MYIFLKRIFAAALLFACAAISAHPQSSPGLTYGQVPTAGQWNSYFAAKQDTLGYTPVNRAGDTMFGKLRTVAPTVSAAGFSLLPGIAPTSPVDGDMWVTSTGLYARINGATIGPLSSTTGTVTSVGISVPAYMAVANSPVTTSGTIGLSFSSQNQNLVFASPGASSGVPTFRSLVGADLPNPSASSLGGVQSIAPVTSNWVRSISTSGVPALSQPAFSDLSGTTNAVTNAMLAQIATQTFKGRTTASTGNVEDLTATQATAILNAVVGDSGSGGTKGLVPAPASGDAGAGKFLKADGTWTVPPTSGTNSGYIFGLTLSNDATDATNDIDISTGIAATDVSSPVLMTLASSLIKRTDAAWAAGTNQGAWLDGASMPNGTGHVFLMFGGTCGVDIGISASLSPTLPAGCNSGKRRIGSILRESAAIVPFSQDGDNFLRTTPVQSVNTSTLGTTAVLFTIGVPVGIKVYALMTGVTFNASAAVPIYVSSPDQADLAPSTTAFTASSPVAAVGAPVGSLSIRTSTTAQIRARAQAASTTLLLSVNGWVDSRGQFN
ncbi:hypothetical protein ACVITL_002784 [Rhizobium pisi]